MRGYDKKRMKEMCEKEIHVVLYKGTKNLNHSIISLSYLKLVKFVLALTFTLLLCFSLWTGVILYRSNKSLDTAYQYKFEQLSSLKIIQQHIEKIQANIQSLPVNQY